MQLYFCTIALTLYSDCEMSTKTGEGTIYHLELEHFYSFTIDYLL